MIWPFSRKKQEQRSDVSWAAVKNLGYSQDYQTGLATYVSPSLAEQVAPVFAAVEVITTAVATLKPMIFRTRDGDRQLVRDHPLMMMLKKPNRHNTWSEFVRDFLADVLLFGNGCAVYVDRELVFIPWRRVAMEQRGKQLRYRYSRPTLYSENTPQITAMEDSVLHVKDRSNGLIGVPRLSRCASTVRLAIAVQEAAETIFGSAVMPSGIFAYKGKADREKRATLQAQLQNQFAGSHNRGKVIFTDQDSDYKVIQPTAESMEFTDMRKFMVAEVARVFNVPVTVLQELSNASYSNASQQARFLTTHSLVYWTTLIEDAFSDLLLQDNERLELDLSVFTRGDPIERWQAYATALKHGVLTPAAVRKLEGWENLVDEDDQQSSDTDERTAIGVVSETAG